MAIDFYNKPPVWEKVIYHLGEQVDRGTLTVVEKNAYLDSVEQGEALIGCSSWHSMKDMEAKFIREKLETVFAEHFNIKVRVKMVLGRPRIIEKKKTKSEPIYKHEVDFGPISESRVCQALRYIDPDCVYQDWIAVGMGLKNEFGDAGLEIWETWSKCGQKYRKKECAQKWKSFKDKGTTIATMFYLAQQQGYVNTSEVKPIRRLKPADDSLLAALHATYGDIIGIVDNHPVFKAAHTPITKGGWGFKKKILTVYCKVYGADVVLTGLRVVANKPSVKRPRAYFTKELKNERWGKKLMVTADMTGPALLIQQQA